MPKRFVCALLNVGKKGEIIVNKKNCIKKLYAFLFCFLILSLNCCNGKNNNGVTYLTLTTTSYNEQIFTELINSYNNSQNNYKVKLLVLGDENEKNKQLKNNEIESDLMTFDNYIVANSYSDKLVDLSSENFVYQYQFSIVNSLKAYTNKLSCLPSIGKFYSNCYNIDLFNENNYTIPNTIDEFLDLITKIDTKNVSPSTFKIASSIASYDSILFSLMQIAYPLLLSTTEGNKFIYDYYYGNTTILNSTTNNSWGRIFKILYQIYENNFYSLNDVYSNLQTELDLFNNKETIAIQNSCDNNIDELISSNINFQYFPFLGDTVDEQLIGSKPLFYLSALNDTSNIKKQGAIDFLTYFSSNEGQNAIIATQKDNNSVSYIYKTFLPLNAKYQNFEKVIKQGKVFIPDIFFSLFNNFSTYIYSYLNNKLSLNEMLILFDNKIIELNS